MCTVTLGGDFTAYPYAPRDRNGAVWTRSKTKLARQGPLQAYGRYSCFPMRNNQILLFHQYRSVTSSLFLPCPYSYRPFLCPESFTWSLSRISIWWKRYRRHQSDEVTGFKLLLRMRPTHKTLQIQTFMLTTAHYGYVTSYTSFCPNVLHCTLGHQQQPPALPVHLCECLGELRGK